VILKRFRRARELAVEFCDRCGSVCDAACRRNAIIERARERALLRGMRLL
jgi:ferredoxin